MAAEVCSAGATLERNALGDRHHGTLRASRGHPHPGGRRTRRLAAETGDPRRRSGFASNCWTSSKYKANSRGRENGLLGSSEVLESIIGKFKHVAGERGQHGLTGMVLSIGALVGNLAVATVQTAMTEITTPEVWNWCRSHLGATVQSVRQRSDRLSTRNKNRQHYALKAADSFTLPSWKSAAARATGPCFSQHYAPRATLASTLCRK